MKTIKFRFLAGPSKMGRIIRFLTRSKWSHVDVLLNRGEAFGALGDTNTVGKYHPERKPYLRKAIVTFRVTDDQYLKFMEELLSKEGTKYDYKGIHAFLVKFNIQEDDKWFCSELLIHALYVAEIIKKTDAPGFWSPDHMWKAISFCTNCEIEYYG